MLDQNSNGFFSQKAEEKSILQWLTGLLILHVFLWTVLPLWVRDALPNDLIEAYLWSEQGALGYDKNPWMPALIAKLGIGLSLGKSVWGYYFLQQLVVVTGLFSTFQLVRSCSNSRYAFLSALMLEACICYTLEVQIMNDNFLLLGFLPAASWMFYEALSQEKNRYWLFSGLLFGLSVMSKYNAILVPAGGFLYLLFYRRDVFKTTGFYLALLVFLAVVTPNVWWLIQHDFSTVNYAFVERGRFTEYNWKDAVWSGLDFLSMTFVNWLPALVLLMFGLLFFRQDASLSFPDVQKDTKRFLFFMGVLPFFFLVFLAIFMGFHLHREWGTTFLGLMGAFLLLFCEPCVHFFSVKRFSIFLMGVMLTKAGLYAWVSSKNDAGNYPAKALAALSEEVWKREMNSPLRVVAGDRYTIGHITLWSKNHPRAWMEWDFKKSSNVKKEDVECHGALFVQSDFKDSHSAYLPGKMFPEFVLKEHPTVHVLPEKILFRPKKTSKIDEPIRVVFGILKPVKKC